MDHGPLGKFVVDLKNRLPRTTEHISIQTSPLRIRTLRLLKEKQRSTLIPRKIPRNESTVACEISEMPSNGIIVNMETAQVAIHSLAVHEIAQSCCCSSKKGCVSWLHSRLMYQAIFKCIRWHADLNDTVEAGVVQNLPVRMILLRVVRSNNRSIPGHSHPFKLRCCTDQSALNL